MSVSNKSFIFRGTIRHRRFTPFDHFFTYPIFMIFVDLNTIKKTLKRSWLWNVDKPAMISFNRDDYHGAGEGELDLSVRKTIREQIGYEVKGPIRLLTHLRYFGYCFNPVSFYYCFNEDDSEVDVIMAEVTNTPWDERHSYVIHQKGQKGKIDNLTADLKKKLHVSPFWGMDHEYEWLFSQPTKNLMVNMINYKDEERVFDATLNMKRIPFTLGNLLKQVARFPFITMLVVFRIHWQAFKLWLKKAPYFIHPDKINLMKGN